jgi:hypothetical protein
VASASGKIRGQPIRKGLEASLASTFQAIPQRPAPMHLHAFWAVRFYLWGDGSPLPTRSDNIMLSIKMRHSSIWLKGVENLSKTLIQIQPCHTLLTIKGNNILISISSSQNESPQSLHSRHLVGSIPEPNPFQLHSWCSGRLLPIIPQRRLPRLRAGTELYLTNPSLRLLLTKILTLRTSGVNATLVASPPNIQPINEWECTNTTLIAGCCAAQIV